MLKCTGITWHCWCFLGSGVSEIPHQCSQNCTSTTRILPARSLSSGSRSDWLESHMVSRFCGNQRRNIQSTTVFSSFLTSFCLFSLFLIIIFLPSFLFVSLSRNHSFFFISSKCSTIPTYYTTIIGTGGSISSTRAQDGTEQGTLCHWTFLIIDKWLKVHKREMPGIHSCHCSRARCLLTSYYFNIFLITSHIA